MQNAQACEVLVCGAGQMGAGIAQVCAVNGRGVALYDAAPGALQRARSSIERRLERAVAKGELTSGDVTAALGRIVMCDDVQAAAHDRLQIAIEAVPEQFAIKAELLRRLDALLRPECLLATNTSSLSVTALAAVTGRPGRVAGMHFMNPVPVMALVEVVRGERTSVETVDAVLALARELGKEPVTVDDQPGFVANRILMPMINEAIGALADGVSDVLGIDTVMRLGMSHPMGPLTLADFIGLDTCLAILETLHAGFGDPRYRPAPLLRRMVTAGLLGRKAGEGFYRYSERGEQGAPVRR